MTNADKVEVMDLLINVIKDHEKNLDTLISRAENLMEDNMVQKNYVQNPPNLRLKLRDWEEFRARAIEAELVCFDLVDSKFLCNAITKTKIYRFCEEIPETRLEFNENGNNSALTGISMGKSNDENISFLGGLLSIGLELRSRKVVDSGEKYEVEYELDLLYTKNWLSRELGIHRNFIVRGNIEN
jgi:hypothetical protein